MLQKKIQELESQHKTTRQEHAEQQLHAKQLLCDELQDNIDELQEELTAANT